METRAGGLRLSKNPEGFPTKGLQSAARRICVPVAHKFHTCSLSSIFSHAHVARENDFTFFAACGRQTLRGFFDTLQPPARRPVRAVFIWRKNKSLPRATARQRTLRTRDSAENAPAKNSISHERGKSRQGDIHLRFLKVGYLSKFIIDIPDAARYAVFSESAAR